MSSVEVYKELLCFSCPYNLKDKRIMNQHIKSTSSRLLFLCLSFVVLPSRTRANSDWCGSCGGHLQRACAVPFSTCHDDHLRIGGCDSELNTNCTCSVSGFCVNKFRMNDEKKNRLRLQHHVDYSAPLNQVTWIGTHNSFCAKDDGFDNFSNQRRNIKAQLDAGFRIINLDLHNRQNHATPMKPIVCHDSTWVESMCHLERKSFKWELEQINDWLQEAGNEEEVIMIVLEDYFDGGSSTKNGARENAIEKITNVLGSKVYSPELHHEGTVVADADAGDRSQLAQLPFDDSSLLTKQMVVDAGANVIFGTTKAMDTRADSCCTCSNAIDWRAVVWELPVVEDSAYAAGEDLVAPDHVDYPTGSMTFVYEDRALHSALIRASDMEDITLKAPHAIGLDYAVIYDRSDGFLWTWTPDFPQDIQGDCAFMEEENGYKWENAQCGREKFVACWKDTNSQPYGKWKVSHEKHSFSQAKNHDVCGDDFGSGWKFRMPYNAYSQKKLIEKANHRGSPSRANVDNMHVWIPYKRNSDGQFKDVCGEFGC